MATITKKITTEIEVEDIGDVETMIDVVVERSL